MRTEDPVSVECPVCGNRAEADTDHPWNAVSGYECKTCGSYIERRPNGDVQLDLKSLPEKINAAHRARMHDQEDNPYPQDDESTDQTSPTEDDTKDADHPKYKRSPEHVIPGSVPTTKNRIRWLKRRFKESSDG